MRFAACLLSALAVGATSAYPTADEMCLDTCQRCLQSLHFGDDEAAVWGTPGSVAACTNVFGLTSLYLCVDVYCSERVRLNGLAGLNETCRENANVSLPGFELIDEYSPADVSRLRKVELEDRKSNETINEVVIPSKRFFNLWLGTIDALDYVNYYHQAYGAAMTYFWLVVVAIGILNHLVSAISNLRIMSRHTCWPLDKAWDYFSWMRSSMMVPATFGYRCAQKIGWGTAPPRLQSLTLLAFLIINIVFSVHGYQLFEGNVYFPDVVKQILRYVSDRTGIISFYNFPLIWLFGMRNNVLMWLTGWDFGTYNNFHRWVARIATVQAIVHSVGYTWLILREGGWSYFAYWWTLMFWWAGEIATVLMSVLLGLSCYWIRRQHYETFLVVHIIMSILVLITMLGHVSIFHGYYDFLFWIPVYIWILDRVLRVGRVLAFNRKIWGTLSSATYNPSSNIIRVSVPWSTSYYRPPPGTYYYLHVLNTPRFWESHPFTVASVMDQEQAGAKTLGEQVPLLESDEDEPSLETTEATELDTASHSMTFLIRPYDSFTSRLRDAAAAAWPQKAPLRVLVDGPYGHTQPFHLFNNVLFVVGGSGIVVPLSYLNSLTQGVSPPTSVHIHWAVREPAFALEVLRNEIGDALGAPNLHVEVYITTHGRDERTDWPSQISLRSGRIEARSVVEAMVEKTDGGSVAVVACGPGQMADDARSAVVDILRRGQMRIEYFEESFQW